MSTVIRLAPSQAFGRFESGMLAAGVDGAARVATGVPCSLSTGPLGPPVTVPQFEGGLPGRFKVGKFQQVMIPRTKKNPLRTAISAPTPRMTCTNESGPIFVFLRELKLFIQV